MTKYNKLLISLRYFLLGASRFANEQERSELLDAYNILEFAKTYHTGMRDDGVTPEFQHQLEITHFLTTIGDSIPHRGIMYAVGLGHDLIEDYGNAGIDLTEIRSRIVNTEIFDFMEDLYKIRNGVKISPKAYEENLLKSPISCIVKGADRINNMGSMIHAFSPERQNKYIIETDDFILGLIKKARRKFPEFNHVFENLKCILSTQLDFAKELNKEEK